MHVCGARHQTPLSVPFPMWPRRIHHTGLCSVLRLFNWHTGDVWPSRAFRSCWGRHFCPKISGYNSVKLNQDWRHLFGISQLKQAQPGRRGEAGGPTQLLESFLFQELSFSPLWQLSAASCLDLARWRKERLAFPGPACWPVSSPNQCTKNKKQKHPTALKND